LDREDIPKGLGFSGCGQYLRKNRVSNQPLIFGPQNAQTCGRASSYRVGKGVGENFKVSVGKTYNKRVGLVVQLRVTKEKVTADTLQRQKAI
jgi:hypothetical protein